MPQGKIVTFFATKGGVGTTTILTNVAVVIAQRFNKRVAVLDCDLQFGDTAIMFNLYPMRTIANLVEEPAPWTDFIRSYIIRHEGSGVDLLLSPSRPEYADIVDLEHIERALELLSDMYDVVLVDTMKLFRNVELALLDRADRIVVVTTLDLPAIKDTKLCLDLLVNLNYVSEKVAVVLNQTRKKFGGLGPDDVRAGLKRDIIEIPYTDDGALIASINRGIPYMLDDENAETPLGQSYLQLARIVTEERELPRPEKPGLLEQLRIRSRRKDEPSSEEVDRMFLARLREPGGDVPDEPADGAGGGTSEVPPPADPESKPGDKA